MLEVTVESFLLVTFVPVVAEISLGARALVAAVAAILHDVHASFALNLTVGTLARVVAVVGFLESKKKSRM